MRYIILLVLVLAATNSYARVMRASDKWLSEYIFQNGEGNYGDIDLGIDANGNATIGNWPARLGPKPTQAQINALVAAYDTRMATKQAAANTLYSTISTRLGITITSKAELQAKLVDVWEALDTKEQQVWTAIEASGLNATRAGQLKQLAQARNKILRLLAEDGIQ